MHQGLFQGRWPPFIIYWWRKWEKYIGRSYNFKTPQTQWTAFKGFFYQIFPASPRFAVVYAPSMPSYMKAFPQRHARKVVVSPFIPISQHEWIYVKAKCQPYHDPHYPDHPPPLPIITSRVWLRLTKKNGLIVIPIFVACLVRIQCHSVLEIAKWFSLMVTTYEYPRASGDFALWTPMERCPCAPPGVLQCALVDNAYKKASRVAATPPVTPSPSFWCNTWPPLPLLQRLF